MWVNTLHSKTIVPQHTISESEFFYAVFKHKKKVNLFPDEKNIILKENVYDHIEQKCQCWIESEQQELCKQTT